MTVRNEYTDELIDDSSETLTTSTSEKEKIAPGIMGLFEQHPEVALPLKQLADLLLNTDNCSLTKGEKELIAAYVSLENLCRFCYESHLAIAKTRGFTFNRKTNAKLDILLKLANKVTHNDCNLIKIIDAATELGATQEDIHVTVLIASAFCMYNRYVSSLNPTTPRNPDWYIDTAEHIIENGYIN